MTTSHEESTGSARPWWPAMRAGLRLRCPRCGIGRLFAGFLTIAPACAHCGHDLSVYRTDDAPAYFTILIVGHIVVPLVLMVERGVAPPLWLHAAVWLPLTIGLSLAFLPRLKGAVLAVQWATRSAES